jgi:hypothetical protein
VTSQRLLLQSALCGSLPLRWLCTSHSLALPVPLTVTHPFPPALLPGPLALCSPSVLSVLGRAQSPHAARSVDQARAAQQSSPYPTRMRAQAPTPRTATHSSRMS